MPCDQAQANLLGDARRHGAELAQFSQQGPRQMREQGQEEPSAAANPPAGQLRDQLHEIS